MEWYMNPSKKEDQCPDRELLRIRSNAELPSHKMAASLDDLDREIIEMHQKDVFFSYADLAEKWSVTPATIRNRIKRMKISGVMDVILVLNPFKIGYNTFAIIGIKLEIGANPDEVISILCAIPGVTNLVFVAGRYDFFIQYVCQNMEEYRLFVAKNLRKVPGIANIESFLGLDLYERKFELGVIS
jgi:DNA-binding Lrp family transcriptional regulator